MGSCGADAANGSVLVTTTPANGFSVSYNTSITLDANGDFTISNPNWTDGTYTIELACSDDLGNGPTNLGPFGPTTIDSTAPVGPGSITNPGTSTVDVNEDLVGSCGADAANGSVLVTTTPANGFSVSYNTSITLDANGDFTIICLLYTSPSPRDATLSRMPSSA